MTSRKIRVGIIGMQPDRSWGAIAHVPALRALPEFEITALSTTRQESADAAGVLYGVPLAFDNHAALVTSDQVDLVAVTVRVQHHLELVSAAVAAGKHVYCEWPYGRDLAEAEQMAALAGAAGVRGFAGLQARFSPTFRYLRDLIEQGYIGELLTTSIFGQGMVWGSRIDQARSYSLDRSNGATLLSIPMGHTIDGVCSVLGEVAQVSAVMANRRTSSILMETGETLAMTAPDQIAFTGLLEGGAPISMHYTGGVTRGTQFAWEIVGTKGDIRVTAKSGGGHAQLAELTIMGATSGSRSQEVLEVPESYYAAALRGGPPANVAEFYSRLARDLNGGSSECPSFKTGVERHRLLDAIERSAETGQAQRL